MSRSADNLARCLLPMLEPDSRRPLTAVQERHEAPETPERPLKLRDVIREHIRYVLDRTDWVIEGPKGAAALLDMKPSTLRYRMRILGIRKPPRPDPAVRVAQLFQRTRPPFRT